METATKTSTDNRELTPTEVQIAVAQIKDRMMRIAKAQTLLSAFVDKLFAKGEHLGDDEDSSLRQDEYENLVETKKEQLSLQFDLPNGVFLFQDHCDEPLLAVECKIFDKYINAFVRGKLTEKAAEIMIFALDEDYECDYGWIFLEQPMHFYNCDDPKDTDSVEDINKEIIRIGTRSKSKVSNLPPLCTWMFGDDQN